MPPAGSEKGDATGNGRAGSRGPIRWTIYQLSVLFLHAALLAFVGYRRFGVRRVPRRGPLLVVANHQSYLDSVVVGCAIYPRVATHLARAGLFKNKAFAGLISTFGAVPIKEDEGDLGAIRTVIARLEMGDAVIVYPEGSRTPDGEIKAFKRGVALIARRTKCHVLPIAIDGGFEVWPRWRKGPRPWSRGIRVMVGEPIESDVLVASGKDGGLSRLESEIRAMHGRLRRMGEPSRRAARAARPDISGA